jgi:uncharacterized protein YciI
MMSPDRDSALEELKLRAFQLYILFGSPTDAWDPTTDTVARVLAEHVEFLRGLEREGTMFMGGPFRASDYDWNGSGMVVVRAGSLDEARSLAEEDPLFVHGLRTYEVRGWQLNEGRLSFSVDLDSNTVGIS